MPYPVGNPRKNHRKKDDQAPMLEMNQSIGTTFPIDHVDFDNGVNEGKHLQLRFPGHVNQYSANGGSIVLYHTTTPPANFLTGLPSLILKKTGGNEIPLTRRKVGEFSSFWYLPCGILMKTCVVTLNNQNQNQQWRSGGGVTLTYGWPLTSPPFTTINAVFITGISSQGNNTALTDPDVRTALVSFNTTQFVIKVTRATVFGRQYLNDVIDIAIVGFGVI